jgi:hypothetical protein
MSPSESPTDALAGGVVPRLPAGHERRFQDIAGVMKGAMGTLGDPNAPSEQAHVSKRLS